MALIKEFKEFAMKGNLIDMAVAFVMGGAFGSVTSKFIDGMVMPIIGGITAGVDFNSLKYIFSEAEIDAMGNVIAAEASIKYGEFLTALINFLVIALCMFVVVKSMNKLKRNREEEPPTLTLEQQLLTEIRDSLNKEKQ